jgi:hypothetical protein
VVHGQQAAAPFREQVIDRQDAREAHVLEILQDDLEENASEGFFGPSLAV